MLRSHGAPDERVHRVSKKKRSAIALRFPALLAALLWAAFACSGQYVLEKKDDSKESYQFIDIDGVCAAYEKNLARFSHLPYGMACGRELDPKLGFTRPTWTKLDLVEHAGLVREIYRQLRWDIDLRNDPRPWIEHAKALVARGITLELFNIDIDGDGTPEHLLRFGSGRPCKPEEEVLSSVMPGRNTFVLADATLTQILPSTITSADDVILYNGKLYVDNFFSVPHPNKRRNGLLYLYKIGRWGTGIGTASICRFRYVDPNLKH
jgi:hypothetical protein